MKYDYLIIGQGLAGSILAYQLLKRKKSLAIIDERKSHTSSTVGAGLVNPFTGPKMVKSWKSEVLFPYLKTFYEELENVTGNKFFSEKTIYRPFNSVEELNDWDGRSSQQKHQIFIKQIHEKNVHSANIEDLYGGVEVYGSVLNMPVFIDSMFRYFSATCTFVSERFDEDALKIFDSEISYKGIKASNIVFCTGYQIQQSRYFGWIPIAPVKGEILHVKIERDFETIYNKSGFIIPLENGYYKAGSTYNRNDLTENPTEQGKNEITKKLDALLKMNYQVVKHEAGVRPGTITRRPLIGLHPEYHRLSIFNGMGTKGVSLAPFFSDQFVKCLEEGNNLDEEVDIKKYYSLYFNSHFSKRN